MTFYLAARYRRREELALYARQLKTYGHRILARWLNGHHERSGATIKDFIKWANEDLSDIQKCSMFVIFLGANRRGGMHVEYGYALALGKRIAIIGRPNGVFHYLPGIAVYRSWYDFLEWARGVA